MKNQQISGKIEQRFGRLKNLKNIAYQILSMFDTFSTIKGEAMTTTNKDTLRYEFVDYVIKNFDRNQIESGIFTAFILPIILREIAKWMSKLLI